MIKTMEKSDPTVSLDLLVRSLFALGTSKQEIAHAISVKKRHSPRIKESMNWHRRISRPYSSHQKNTTDA